MIILASASPRRQELLKLIAENFIVIPSDIDEGVPNNIETEKSPEYLAVKRQSIYMKTDIKMML